MGSNRVTWRAPAMRLRTKFCSAVFCAVLPVAVAPSSDARWSFQARFGSGVCAGRSRTRRVDARAICDQRGRWRRYHQRRLPREIMGRFRDSALRSRAGKTFGQTLSEAFGPRFGALQFEDGAFFGARNDLGVVASPRDFAWLGRLWLNRGRWRGLAVVEEKVFAANVRPPVPMKLPRAITVAKGTKPDDQLGVGSDGGARTYQANGLWNRDTVTISRN